MYSDWIKSFTVIGYVRFFTLLSLDFISSLFSITRYMCFILKLFSRQGHFSNYQMTRVTRFPMSFWSSNFCYSIEDSSTISFKKWGICYLTSFPNRIIITMINFFIFLVHNGVEIGYLRTFLISFNFENDDLKFLGTTIWETFISVKPNKVKQPCA